MTHKVQIARGVWGHVPILLDPSPQEVFLL